MAFDTKTQPKQGTDQQKQGGPNPTNLKKPVDETTKQGQSQGTNPSKNRMNEDEIEQDGKGTMPNPKESNQFSGSGSGRSASGNSGSTGASDGSKR